jgi:hypothetical protein
MNEPTFAAPAASSPLVQRMIGAAMLNVNTYEEVEADQTATGQAATVVAIAAVAGAIGSFAAGFNAVTAIMAVVSILLAFAGWIVMSYVTFFVGTRLFEGKADVGELMRTLGFAQAPRILGIAVIVPILGMLVAVVVGLWSLATTFIAIRQALDLDNMKAAMTAIVSWVVMTVIIMVPMGIISALVVGVVAAGAR